MSEVKVNKISPRTNCGTVTLGDSGDTFTIPAGVTITNSGTANGFGGNGAANWQTTIKTGDFTAVSGEGYFVNTTSGAVTVTLPSSPSAGDIVAVKDYAETFDTNALTIARNGSNIGGQAQDSTVTTEGIALTLVYADATKGWLVTDSGLQSEAPGPQFIAATGGTVTTVCTNFKVHTFTGPGTFCVSSAGNSAGSNTVSYMVIAGGGGGGIGYGGGYCGGGGGAGGFREGLGLNDSYTGSPLRAPTGVPVSVQGYPITVGAGGSGRTGCSGCGNGPNVKAGDDGSNSIFSTITSAGGGGGAGGDRTPSSCAGAGGSGGGGGSAAGYPGSPAGTGGNGNTPPVSPPQGSNGGNGPGTANNAGAGGGGATAVGANTPGNCGGAGGAGATSSINATPTARAGGGGGSGNTALGAGGTGGGGNGGKDAPPSSNGVAGTTNTGGGGGGGTRYSRAIAGAIVTGKHKRSK